MARIRPAILDDLEAITAIYNHAVINTTACFDIEPKSMAEQRAWFEAHDEDHPILVAEENGMVVGWAALSRFDGRCAYDGTGEFSVYIDEKHRGRGLGKAMLRAALEAGRATRLRTIIARISHDNTISVALHEQAGFQHAGVLRQVGFKFGTTLDVVIMQYFLQPVAAETSPKATPTQAPTT